MNWFKKFLYTRIHDAQTEFRTVGVVIQKPLREGFRHYQYADVQESRFDLGCHYYECECKGSDWYKVRSKSYV